MTEWISVKEKLPPIDKSFLCIVHDNTYDTKDVYFAAWNYYINQFEGWKPFYQIILRIEDNYRHKIISWMLLPKLPGEK